MVSKGAICNTFMLYPSCVKESFSPSVFILSVIFLFTIPSILFSTANERFTSSSSLLFKVKVVAACLLPSSSAI